SLLLFDSSPALFSLSATFSLLLSSVSSFGSDELPQADINNAVKNTVNRTINLFLVIGCILLLSFIKRLFPYNDALIFYFGNRIYDYSKNSICRLSCL